MKFMAFMVSIGFYLGGVTVFIINSVSRGLFSCVMNRCYREHFPDAFLILLL